ncbi:MAG: NYN domain-containing protein [Acidimicrobiia bacterium]|nr:NYN domain-containing protein [Acidimicrobiia bacterium]
MLPAVRVFGSELAGIIYGICEISGVAHVRSGCPIRGLPERIHVGTAGVLSFTSGIPHWEGQVDPLALGRLIIDRSPYDRTLAGVRIYRGVPHSTKDPKGYGACMRQIASWSKLAGVQVYARPLRYPYGWPRQKPEEKGIDVAMAVDFVLMAARREYDVGILMSADTDLKPALEAVITLGSAKAEVAAWSSQYGHLEASRNQEPEDMVPLARPSRLHHCGGSTGLHRPMKRNRVICAVRRRKSAVRPV